MNNDEAHLKATQVVGVTDVGCVRSANEDCYIIQPIEKPLSPLNNERMVHDSTSDLFVAVSDGMGGAAAGEVASSTALLIISEHLTQHKDELAEAKPEELVGIVENGIQMANQAIFEAAQNNRAQKGMGATMTALYLRDDVAYLFQIGDSRAYLLRKGVFAKITRDQSFVGHLVEMGTITEEQAARHPQRNVILQAMGTSDRLKVDLSFIPVCRDDLIVLCTDGLYSEIEPHDLEKDVKKMRADQVELGKRVQTLVDRAKENGGRDNVTVVGLQMNEHFPIREPGENPKFLPFPFLDEDNPFSKMFQVQG